MVSQIGIAALLRLLGRVGGDERDYRRNLQLASVLAFMAGLVNSVGYAAAAVYTSHMTGLTASLADRVVVGGARLAVISVVGLGSFIGGAMACALLFNWGRRRELHSRYANVLTLEALLILVFGMVARAFERGRGELLVITVLCAAMGLQNAIITKISGAQIRTTHVTGMITDIGIELGKLVYRNRAPIEDRVRADRRKLAMLTWLVGLFFVGGIVGATGYLQVGFSVILPAAAVLLSVSLPPLFADIRTARPADVSD